MADLEQKLPHCKNCHESISDCACDDYEPIELEEEKTIENFLGVDFKYVPGDPFW